MSDGFEPAAESPEPLPEIAPRNKNISPWLLGCGVLVMALFALGVFAAVVAGILMFAVRPQVHSLPLRAAASVAQQRLPDGSLLVLEQVTYGTQHQFFGEGELPLATVSGSPVPAQGPSVHTSQDAIVVWLTQWDAMGKPKDFDWFLRCAAVDAHGNEVDNTEKGRFADGRSGSRSEHNGIGPFAPLTGGMYDRIVAHFALPPFRHAGATFKLRFYDTQNRKIAEFDVANPRASGGAYPQWQPEPLPITKSDGDLSLTLTALTARSSESTQTVNGFTMKETRVQLVPRFETAQAGQPTADWNDYSYRVFDALGRESNIWDCELSPKESAWELEVKAWRSDSARFDPDEIWALAKLPAPKPQQAQYVNETRTMDGVALTVVAVGGSGKLSYPGVPVANRGGYSTSGSNTFGQGNQRRQFRYEIEVDKGQTTIESEAPYVLVQVSGLSRDQRFSLRVKNDAGGEVQLAGPRTFASSLYVWFMDITEDAKALNAEVIVHRCRTFTFLVAPPQIGPPQPSVPSRSPRSAEQRLADARRAIDSNQRALAANPANANVLNNLAWAYVTAPEELRDADQAVSFAQRATQLNPGDYNSLNTLGTAYYRAGQYDLALSTLERNAAARTDSLVVFDLYPLAMTQFQLEQSDKAKETYQRALDLHRRIETDLSLNHWQELYEFRIEAATLLLGEPPQAVFERAGQLAREGKWEPAADEFAKGLEIYPVDHWQWYRAGALQAYRNQPEEFRDICRKMLDLFGDTNDPFIAERAGKLALLLPDALPGDARPAQLCDKSASWRPDVPWFQLASAIARYRDKKYQDALARLQTAEAQVGNQVYCHVLIELFRAMSLHRLEQQEAARQSLEAALRRLGEITPKPPEAEEATLDYGSGWHDYLMCEVVRREAETLVGDETVP